MFKSKHVWLGISIGVFVTNAIWGYLSKKSDEIWDQILRNQALELEELRHKYCVLKVAHEETLEEIEKPEVEA